VYRRDVLPAKLKIELDYLDRRTVIEDLRVLAHTVAALFSRRTRLEPDRGSEWRI
jgi:lipopolysaccharide/colanic/teichoic acid biosynthesis glycosyltransferase